MRAAARSRYCAECRAIRYVASRREKRQSLSFPPSTRERSERISSPCRAFGTPVYRNCRGKSAAIISNGAGEAPSVTASRDTSPEGGGTRKVHAVISSRPAECPFHRFAVPQRARRRIVVQVVRLAARPVLLALGKTAFRKTVHWTVFRSLTPKVEAPEKSTPYIEPPAHFCAGGILHGFCSSDLTRTRIVPSCLKYST